MGLDKTFSEKMASLEREKRELEQERKALIHQLAMLQQAEAQRRVEMLAKIVEDGVRLGMAIEKPGHKGKWIDVTEAAMKLIVDIQGQRR